MVAEKRGSGTPRRNQAEDALDVGDEAHVEHPVGLVHDHDLHAREEELAALDVVEEAAGRRDEHVHAPVDERVLVLEAHAADEEGLRELQVRRVLVEVLGHLAASSRVGHRTRERGIRARGPPLREARDHGAARSRRLARSRLGDAQDVAALERGRGCASLDRGWG
jgi:hypothetical protein